MSGDEIFSVEAEVIRCATNTFGGVRLTFDTQENLRPEIKGRLTEWHNGKPGHLVFLQDKEVDPEQFLKLPEITKKGKRSQSQKIRFLLHRIAIEEGVKDEDFETFYERETERYLTMLQQRLEVPIDEV